MCHQRVNGFVCLSSIIEKRNFNKSVSTSKTTINHNFKLIPLVKTYRFTGPLTVITQCLNMSDVKKHCAHKNNICNNVKYWRIKKSLKLLRSRFMEENKLNRYRRPIVPTRDVLSLRM